MRMGWARNPLWGNWLHDGSSYPPAHKMACTLAHARETFRRRGSRSARPGPGIVDSLARARRGVGKSSDAPGAAPGRRLAPCSEGRPRVASRACAYWSHFAASPLIRRCSQRRPAPRARTRVLVSFPALTSRRGSQPGGCVPPCYFCYFCEDPHKHWVSGRCGPCYLAAISCDFLTLAQVAGYRLGSRSRPLDRFVVE
jgi:hypothetical protein